MVVVPAGRFTMGSSFGPDVEKPAREVHVQAGFALSSYEVTVAEWEACVGAGGCEGYAPSDAGPGGDREPVTNISWNDAQGYVAWLRETTGAAYRLPSEAEWEYAARAGSDGKFTSGAVILEKDANFAGANGGPTPVGSYPPNAFGLHDVHGNVWEWVEDCIHPYPSFPTTAAPARVQDCQLRGLRGGAWDSDASALRLANRAFRESAVRHPTIGFRIARSLTPGDLQAHR
jgi:formylglycine-generating enzyme required for sulfatase activity